MQTPLQLDIWLQSDEGFVHAKNNITHLNTVFANISKTTWRHPTHFPWSCHIFTTDGHLQCGMWDEVYTYGFHISVLNETVHKELHFLGYKWLAHSLFLMCRANLNFENWCSYVTRQVEWKLCVGTVQCYGPAEVLCDMFSVYMWCIYSNAVIFIGPFKISTDKYHAIHDNALSVYKQYGFANY